MAFVNQVGGLMVHQAVLNILTQLFKVSFATSKGDMYSHTEKVTRAGGKIDHKKLI